MPKITICVLTYGDYPHLAMRAIESIRRNSSLRTPDPVEKRWPEIATSRRSLRPLLGERAGERAVVSAHIDSTSSHVECSEAGILSPSDCSVIVGANAPGAETRAYLTALHNHGQIDHLILSEVNLNTSP